MTDEAKKFLKLEIARLENANLKQSALWLNLDAFVFEEIKVIAIKL